MSVTIQPVAKDFWIVRQDRKYLGVIRLIHGTEQGGLYVPWFEASQIGEGKPTLEAAADVLAGA